jgi:hypothetical protein
MRPQLKRVIAVIVAVLVGFAVLYLLIPNPASSHGYVPRDVYQNQVSALKAACAQYRADFNADPPARNPDFFDALAGKNKLGKLYVQIRAGHDSSGQVLDPWGIPYLLLVKDGTIEVYSNNGK